MKLPKVRRRKHGSREQNVDLRTFGWNRLLCAAVEFTAVLQSASQLDPFLREAHPPARWHLACIQVRIDGPLSADQVSWRLVPAVAMVEVGILADEPLHGVCIILLACDMRNCSQETMHHTKSSSDAVLHQLELNYRFGQTGRLHSNRHHSVRAALPPPYCHAPAARADMRRALRDGSNR